MDTELPVYVDIILNFSLMFVSKFLTYLAPLRLLSHRVFTLELKFNIVCHLRFTTHALLPTASAEKNKLPALAESARPGPRVTTEAKKMINF